MSETKETALVPSAPELPEPVARRKITEAQWRTLKNNLFPGAETASVLMVWDYCAARGLDPMKKPCHIVPMEVKDAKTGEYGWRDVVMPGIYEYRITAHRTGQYMGHTEPEFGPITEQFGVLAPEWCKMTILRWNPEARANVQFPVTVYFSEVVGTRKNKQTGKIEANARWMRAPRQMHVKCTEAAGLREAFPEEIGGEPTAEEMDGQRAINVTPTVEMPQAVATALDKIPEAMRDAIDRAFAILELLPAQRLAKATEFIGADGVKPEEGAEALLAWCEAEHKKRSAPDTGTRKKRGNAKTPPDVEAKAEVVKEPEPPPAVVPTPVQAPPVQDASDLF